MYLSGEVKAGSQKGQGWRVPRMVHARVVMPIREGFQIPDNRVLMDLNVAAIFDLEHRSPIGWPNTSYRAIQLNLTARNSLYENGLTPVGMDIHQVGLVGIKE